jgi:mRNA interferase RelE/StbE
LTIYRVELRPRAKRAWDKLSPKVRGQFQRKLDERRRHRRVPSAQLSQMPGCYKIKLRAEGLRAVYQVRDDLLLLLVLAVGKRERNDVYDEASRELRRID